MDSESLKKLTKNAKLYRCATCHENPANEWMVYYAIPFCSEECYNRHSPVCEGCLPDGHWVLLEPEKSTKMSKEEITAIKEKYLSFGFWIGGVSEENREKAFKELKSIGATVRDDEEMIEIRDEMDYFVIYKKNLIIDGDFDL